MARHGDIIEQRSCLLFYEGHGSLLLPTGDQQSVVDLRSSVDHLHAASTSVCEV